MTSSISCGCVPIVIAYITVLLLHFTDCLLQSSSNYVIPQFEQLPAQTIYLKNNDPITLNCVPTSPDSVVHCGYRLNPSDPIRISIPNSVLIPGVRCLNRAIFVNPSEIAADKMDQMQLFCKVISVTKFAIISHPFRLKRAVLGDFPESSFVQTKEAYKGNNVQIECKPPLSVPEAKITFTANGKELPGFAYTSHRDRERYRIVTLASGTVVLLIKKVLTEDGAKSYSCNATNPITGVTKESLVKTYLRVRQAVEVFGPKIVAAPSPDSMMFSEGDNVSYTCITESSPIAEVSFLRGQGRLPLPPSAKEDRSFGLLQFNGIQFEDAGEYACRVSYIDPSNSNNYMPKTKLSKFTVSVKKRLTIAVKPDDVTMEDSSSSFVCRLQGSVAVSPMWMNNGRAIDFKDSSMFTVQNQPGVPGMSRLLVRRFEDRIRGVIQCIAADPSHNIWDSEQATLLRRGEFASLATKNVQRPPVASVPTPRNSRDSGNAAAARLPSTRDGGDSSADSVKHQTYSLSESFVQIDCGTVLYDRNEYAVSFYKDGQLIRAITDSQLSKSREIQQRYVKIDFKLMLIRANDRTQIPYYEGVYVCKISNRSGDIVRTEKTILKCEDSAGGAVLPLPSPNPDQKTQPPPIGGNNRPIGGINTNPVAPEPEKQTERPKFVGTPSATVIPGNLAVNISWRVKEYSYIQKLSHFRVQYLEAPSRDRFNENDPKLIAKSLPLRAGQQEYYFIWRKPRSRHDYRFRIAYQLRNSMADMYYSRWSEVASFSHIADVKNPRIRKVPQHLHDSLEWSFDGSPYEILGYYIWLRQVEGSERGYVAYRVEKATATKFYFYDLKPDTNYELMMFAELKNPDSPGGTPMKSPNSPPVQFNAKFVKTLDDAKKKDDSKLDGSTLMFILFGVLGGVTVIALIGLSLMCARRSMMEKRRGEQGNEAWSNTFTYASHLPGGYPSGTYKDPAKMIHRETLSRQNPHNNFSLSMLNGQAQPSPAPPVYGGYAGYPGTVNLPFNMMQHAAEASPMLLDHYQQQMYMGSQQQMYMGSQQRLHHPGQMPPAYGLGTLTKREPPSGGSLHENPSDIEDFDAAETLYQRGGSMHQQPSSFGYSQTAQRLGINLNPPGMPGDNESVYSYFSQFDTYAQTPFGQQTGSRAGSHLNVMVDSGAQTVHDRPTHRHHRRKRRRQQGPREAPSTPPVMRDMSTNTDFELSEAAEDDDDMPPPPPPHHHHGTAHHSSMGTSTSRGHHNNGEIYERPEDVLGHSMNSGHSGFQSSTPIQPQSMGSREHTPQRAPTTTTAAGATTAATASLHRPGRNLHMMAGPAMASSLPRRAFSPGPPKMRGITDYAVPQQLMNDPNNMQQSQGAPSGLSYAAQPQVHLPYQSNRSRQQQDYPV